MVAERIPVTSARFSQLTGHPEPRPEKRAGKLWVWWHRVESQLINFLTLALSFFGYIMLVFQVRVLGYEAKDSKIWMARARMWGERLIGMTIAVHLQPDAQEMMFPVTPQLRPLLLKRLADDSQWPPPPDAHEQETHVLITNHQTILEIVLLPTTIPKRSLAVARSELKHLPIFSHMWRACGAYFLERSGRDTAVATLKRMSDEIRAARVPLMIFPEGTRNRALDGVLPLKKGAFHMAMDARSPVVPYLISPLAWLVDPTTGTWLIPWYRRRTGRPLQVWHVALRPIPTAHLTKEHLPAIMQRTWQLMQLAYEALDRLSAVRTGAMPRLLPNQVMFQVPTGLVAATAASTPFDRTTFQPSVWPEAKSGEDVYDPRGRLTRQGILGSLPELLQPYAFGYPPQSSSTA